MIEEKSDEEIKVLLHKLIYQVLIEIREEAHYIDNKKIEKLSGLVHNLPLKLSKPDCNYRSIIEELKQQAESIGAGKWLENSIRQL